MKVIGISAAIGVEMPRYPTAVALPEVGIFGTMPRLTGAFFYKRKAQLWRCGCRLHVAPARSVTMPFSRFDTHHGLESVVTWILTPTSTGTRLRMEQSGFRQDQPQFYEGAKGGWQRFFGELERMLSKLA